MARLAQKTYKFAVVSNIEHHMESLDESKGSAKTAGHPARQRVVENWDVAVRPVLS
jgi:hypothetical protein